MQSLNVNEAIRSGICGVIAGDEARHEAFYTRMMAEVLEHDPAGGILAFRSMLRGRIAMPGRFMDDGRDPDLFDRFAIVAQRTERDGHLRGR